MFSFDIRETDARFMPDIFVLIQNIEFQYGGLIKGQNRKNARKLLSPCMMDFINYLRGSRSSRWRDAASRHERRCARKVQQDTRRL